MRVLWKYLKPQKGLVLMSLVLAAISQVLALYDPIIFGQIIDKFATPPYTLSPDERVQGAIQLMLLAVGIALLSRLAKAFQEYMTNLVVQKFGVQIFNDGLKQTLCWKNEKSWRKEIMSLWWSKKDCIMPCGVSR